MKTYYKIALASSLLGLMACGGGGSSASSVSTPPVSVAPSFSVSASSLTFSGKRFRELPDSQRINLDYDATNVDFIAIEVVGQTQIGEPLEGANNNLFRTSIDTNTPVRYVDVFPVFPNIEGGTYVDELTLQPRFLNGTTGSITVVDLTLIQEPTTPITAELNDADDAIVEVTEDGPPVRVAITVNAGNSIRWTSEGSRFVQDGGVSALASAPEAGLGTEQVSLVITPTDTLIETLEDDGFFNLRIAFIDEDGRDNFFNLPIEARLAASGASKTSADLPN
jgi:hypothetical protein